MKIMVLNSSGSVGKSTITRELFASRLDDALIIEVEAQNTSTKDFISDKNKKYFRLKVFDNNFENLYLDLIENENVIVDVGASQIENFFVELDKIAGIEMLFDYFIVPVVSTDKAQNDTIKTLMFLKNRNIDTSKIKVIFNAVKNSVESDFDILLKAAKNLDFNLDTDLFIRENKVFQELGLMRKTLADVYHEDLDYYKDKILKADDAKIKLALVKIDLANRLGHTAIDDLDYVFEKITNQKSTFKERFGSNSKSDVKKSKSKKEVQEVQEELNADEDEDL